MEAMSREAPRHRREFDDLRLRPAHAVEVGDTYYARGPGITWRRTTSLGSRGQSITESRTLTGVTQNTNASEYHYFIASRMTLIFLFK